MNETANALSALANMFLAGSAIAGAIAAFMGLETWRRQLSWETDTKLSRQILVQLFKHQDALNGVRNSMIWSAESDDAMTEEDKAEPQERKEFLATFRVYQQRWEKVREARAEMYPLILEARALWGRELEKKLEPMNVLETELRVAISRYMRSINPGLQRGQREAAAKRMDEKTWETIFCDYGETDEWSENYKMSLQEVEVYLQQFSGSK